jgi:hypothetical protein
MLTTKLPDAAASTQGLGTKTALLMVTKDNLEFRNTGDSHLQYSSDIQAGCRPSGRQVLAAANRLRQLVAAP